MGFYTSKNSGEKGFENVLPWFFTPFLRFNSKIYKFEIDYLCIFKGIKFVNNFPSILRKLRCHFVKFKEIFCEDDVDLSEKMVFSHHYTVQLLAQFLSGS